MTKTESGAHTRYYIRYHFVWIVKYRKGLLFRPDLNTTVKDLIHGIADRYDFMVDTFGTDGDHVHVFLGAAPRYSPSRVAEILKSISAKKLFERHPDVRTELWGGEFWGDGYYVGTVGHEVTEDVVKRYINNQGKESNHKPLESMQITLF